MTQDTHKELPQIEFLSEADKAAFEDILKSNEPTLLRPIELTVIVFVNTERSAWKLPKLPQAKDVKAMQGVERSIHKAIENIECLVPLASGLLLYDTDQFKGDSILAMLRELEHKASVGQEFIDVKRGKEKNASIRYMANMLAHILYMHGYILRKSEKSKLAQCIKQALKIAADSDYDKSVKTYVIGASEYLKQKGLDPLRPPKSL